MSKRLRCDECGREEDVTRAAGWFSFDNLGLDDRRMLEWRNALPLHFCSAECAAALLAKVAKYPADRGAAVVVVIKGSQVVRFLPEDKPLRVELGKAIAQWAGYPEQSIDEWELRFTSGEPVDMDLTPRQAHIGAGSMVYLNPRAGIGG